jgi:16S rRNA (cytosine1402-N4)-methyltransferase
MDEQKREETPEAVEPHKRRVRYKGTHPHTFKEKYKELNPENYRGDIEKVIARGDTPAGSHRSICVDEILEVLAPKPGETAVDCTLGYGGHSKEILKRLLPGGKLYGLDADPIEIAKTEERMRAEGFSSDVFEARHLNFAGLPKLLEKDVPGGFDIALADLGVSSMQIDNPERGFTFKRNGPLDMRMNPSRGASAAMLLDRLAEKKLASILKENADEPASETIARVLCVRRGKILTTRDLATAVRDALTPKHKTEEDITKAIRRTFQAIRIEVNGEFSALDTLLARIGGCMKSGGRLAILTFHSGEDRRVAGSFMGGLESGVYSAVSETAITPTAQEKYSNPRATSARLRWAIKA